jgi:integrase
LRVTECCELRIKDIDLDQGLVFVRSGKGDKDRSTLLAEVCGDQLQVQLRKAEAVHRSDRASGLADVSLPNRLERKYANAGTELGWFWVFPSTVPRGEVADAAV